MRGHEIQSKIRNLLETSGRAMSISEIMRELRLNLLSDTPKDTIRKQVQRALIALEAQHRVRTSAPEIRKGVAGRWIATEKRTHKLAKPNVAADIGIDLLDSFLPPAIHNVLATSLQNLSPTLIDAVVRKRLKERVVTIPRRPLLLPPKGKPVVMNQILEAVLTRKRFRAIYESRNTKAEHYQEYHALGLVIRENVIYVVARFKWNKQLRHFALHRFSAFQPLPGKFVETPENFTLENWVTQSDLGDGGKKCKVSFLMDQEVAFHLREMPLSTDQIINSHRRCKSKVKISATVHENEELIWWFLGFGSQVEVLEPEYLRNEISKRVKEAANMYEV